MKEEILGIALPITKEQKSRLNEKGFMNYPPYPDLSEYKDILGLEMLMKHKHSLDWDITTIYNSLYSNYIHNDNNRNGKTEDLVYTMNNLCKLRESLYKAIQTLLKRYGREVKLC